ncbi:hypothetical protein GCM10027430_30790 [Lysobacter tyrosinilyticus]
MGLSGRSARAAGPETHGCDKSQQSKDWCADTDAADDWLKKTNVFSAATGALHLGRFADRMYFITDDIQWSPNSGQEAHKPVRVPAGFVTDFASIPRLFWGIFPTDGRYAYAAIIHDYLYWFQERSREEADLIFKFAMQDFKVPAATVVAVHAAVRAAGEFAWRSNRQLRTSGEKRVLRKYPEDPVETWAVWKKKPGVLLH